MWSTYVQPTSLDDVLAILAERDPGTRLIAGGTDILVELSRGIRPAERLVDLTRVNALDYIRLDDGIVRIGALATHNDVVASPICVERSLPAGAGLLGGRARRRFERGDGRGQPGHRLARQRHDHAAGGARGPRWCSGAVAATRMVPICDFYLGCAARCSQPDELLREIRVPAMRRTQRGIFLKLGLRRAQAISVIDLAVVLASRRADGPFGGDRARARRADDRARDRRRSFPGRHAR